MIISRRLLMALLVFEAVSFVSAQHCHAQRETTGVPRFDAAINRAVGFLQSKGQLAGQGTSLVAYALLKAGEEPNSPLVAAGINTARQRATSTGYPGYNHIYLCGVDAMLLADAKAAGAVESIQSIVNHVQSSQRSDGSWSDTPNNPGDVSMTQYGMLALWAAQRTGCDVSGASVDRAAGWLIHNSNPDGGWAYRPGHKLGPGAGESTHNMTMAAAGSLSIARILLHGDRAKRIARNETEAEKKKYGVLEREKDEEAVAPKAARIGDYKSQFSPSEFDQPIDRAFDWIETRFRPVSNEDHKIYFYYALERAAVLNGISDDWYTTYGDGLLTLQGNDGGFNTHSGPEIGSAFAILFLMRSTEQIMERYGRGRMRGARDLQTLLNPDAGKKRKDIGPLDDLLEAIEGQDFASLEINPEDLVDKIQFSSREELIGETDKLRLLVKHPDAEKRQIAYWALGRTGDFELIPLMLDGLRDPSIDVNVEALIALRNISRRPNGFGMTLNPLGKLPNDADDEMRLTIANQWKTECTRAWRTWYRGVRPYDERDGLDEAELSPE